MRRLLTAAQMRAIEDAAARAGVSTGQLMDAAGRKLAEHAQRHASARGQFLIVCGRGNNGGDGLVAARYLLQAGRAVKLELVGDPARPLNDDPARNLEALARVGLRPAPIPEADGIGVGDVVIDALFGTGLGRAPAGEHAEAIRKMAAWRAQGARIIAADLPSGVQSDSGQVLSPAVSADATISFGALKVGHAVEPGLSRCGAVEVVDIGLPSGSDDAAAPPHCWLVEEADVQARLPERRGDTHKGSYGHVLVIAGSYGKTGAAAMAAMACLRGGAGLVTVATRPEALEPVMAHAPEIMGVELEPGGALEHDDLDALLEAAEGKRAIVLGPGIPRGPGTAKLLGALFEQVELPIVVDADGLNAVAEDLSVLKRSRAPLLLTPHPGEMARLTAKAVSVVQSARVQVGREFATSRKVTLLLKGARSLTCTPDGTVLVNPTGNAGMATGGTGDILSGLLGALLAQGLMPPDAAMVGAYAHGLAGDLAARRTGQLGLVATDLLQGLCEVWVRWNR